MDVAKEQLQHTKQHIFAAKFWEYFQCSSLEQFTESKRTETNIGALCISVDFVMYFKIAFASIFSVQWSIRMLLAKTKKSIAVVQYHKHLNVVAWKWTPNICNNFYLLFDTIRLNTHSNASVWWCWCWFSFLLCDRWDTLFFSIIRIQMAYESVLCSMYQGIYWLVCFAIAATVQYALKTCNKRIERERDFIQATTLNQIMCANVSLYGNSCRRWLFFASLSLAPKMHIAKIAEHSPSSSSNEVVVWWRLWKKQQYTPSPTTNNVLCSFSDRSSASLI